MKSPPLVGVCGLIPSSLLVLMLATSELMFWKTAASSTAARTSAVVIPSATFWLMKSTLPPVEAIKYVAGAAPSLAAFKVVPVAVVFNPTT